MMDSYKKQSIKIHAAERDIVFVIPRKPGAYITNNSTAENSGSRLSYASSG